ncbi:MAG: hypothetical protein ABIS36_11360 [Chryseolinea sp.]
MDTRMDSASYKAQPLSEDELRDTSGGVNGWATFFGGLAATALGEIVKDWDNFKNGIAGRPERAL